MGDGDLLVTKANEDRGCRSEMDGHQQWRKTWSGDRLSLFHGVNHKHSSTEGQKIARFNNSFMPGRPQIVAILPTTHTIFLYFSYSDLTPSHPHAVSIFILQKQPRLERSETALRLGGGQQ